MKAMKQKPLSGKRERPVSTTIGLSFVSKGAAACLPHSDVILSGLVNVVHLHDDGEDGVRTGGRFVHCRSADGAHFLPLIHEAVDPFLVAHDRLSQALRTTMVHGTTSTHGVRSPKLGWGLVWSQLDCVSYRLQ